MKQIANIIVVFFLIMGLMPIQTSAINETNSSGNATELAIALQDSSAQETLELFSDDLPILGETPLAKEILQPEAAIQSANEVVSINTLLSIGNTTVPDDEIANFSLTVNSDGNATITDLTVAVSLTSMNHYMYECAPYQQTNDSAYINITTCKGNLVPNGEVTIWLASINDESIPLPYNATLDTFVQAFNADKDQADTESRNVNITWTNSSSPSESHGGAGGHGVINVSECGWYDTNNVTYKVTGNINSDNWTNTFCIGLGGYDATLDCDGYSITGNGTGNIVEFSSIDTKIVNCNFFNAANAIRAWSTHGAALDNNTYENMSNSAIYFNNMTYSKISNSNFMLENRSPGVLLVDSAGNDVFLNYFENLDSGYSQGAIRMGWAGQPASGNNIYNNTFNETNTGLFFEEGHQNEISYNKFVNVAGHEIHFNNGANATRNKFWSNELTHNQSVETNGQNMWNNSGKGNHWLGYDGCDDGKGIAEGQDTCVDNDHNGFCDSPYNLLGGGIDELPVAADSCSSTGAGSSGGALYDFTFEDYLYNDTDEIGFKDLYDIWEVFVADDYDAQLDEEMLHIQINLEDIETNLSVCTGGPFPAFGEQVNYNFSLDTRFGGCMDCMINGTDFEISVEVEDFGVGNFFIQEWNGTEFVNASDPVLNYTFSCSQNLLQVEADLFTLGDPETIGIVATTEFEGNVSNVSKDRAPDTGWLYYNTTSLQNDTNHTNVTIDKIVLNTTVENGSIVEFILNITNHVLEDAMNYFVIDRYNDGLDFDNQTSTGYDIFDPNANEIEWMVNISGNTSSYIYLNFTASRVGTTWNYVWLEDQNETPIDDDNVTINITSTPSSEIYSVDVDKQVLQDPVNVGDIVSFNVSVRNNGTETIGDLYGRDYFNISEINFTSATCAINQMGQQYADMWFVEVNVSTGGATLGAGNPGESAPPCIFNFVTLAAGIHENVYNVTNSTWYEFGRVTEMFEVVNNSSAGQNSSNETLCGSVIAQSVTLENDILNCEADATLHVQTSNIVIDCDGHTLSGNGTSYEYYDLPTQGEANDVKRCYYNNPGGDVSSCGVGVRIINATNVTVQNCNFENYVAAINGAYDSNNNTFRNNTATNVHTGFKIETWSTSVRSSGNKFIGNTVTNSIGIGIASQYADYTIVSNNTINNCSTGIFMQSSDRHNVYNTIEYNTVEYSSLRGFWIDDTNSSTIRHNKFFNNSVGIKFSSSNHNIFTFNELRDNYKEITINATYSNQTNETINGTVIRDYTNFLFYNSYNNTIENNTFGSVSFYDDDDNIAVIKINDTNVTINPENVTVSNVTIGNATIVRGLYIALQNMVRNGQYDRSYFAIRNHLLQEGERIFYLLTDEDGVIVEALPCEGNEVPDVIPPNGCYVVASPHIYLYVPHFSGFVISTDDIATVAQSNITNVNVSSTTDINDSNLMVVNFTAHGDNFTEVGFAVYDTMYNTLVYEATDMMQAQGADAYNFSNDWDGNVVEIGGNHVSHSVSMQEDLIEIFGYVGDDEFLIRYNVSGQDPVLQSGMNETGQSEYNVSELTGLLFTPIQENYNGDEINLSTVTLGSEDIIYGPDFRVEYVLELYYDNGDETEYSELYADEGNITVTGPVSPDVTLVFPDVYSATNTEIVFVANVTRGTYPVDNCTLIIDDVDTSTNTSFGSQVSFNETVSGGNHYWNVACSDKQGNIASDSPKNFSIAITFPNVDLDSPVNNYISSSDVVSFTANITEGSYPIDNCTLLIDNEENISNTSISGSQVFFTTTVADGIYSWSVACSDIQGYGVLDASRELLVDTTAPSVTATYPTTRYYSTNPSSYNITVTDETSIVNCTYYIYNVSDLVENVSVYAGGENESAVMTLSNDGNYSWNATCVDVAGHVTASATTDYVLDTTDPSTSFDVLGTQGVTAWYVSATTVNLTATDVNLHKTYYSWNGSAFAEYTGLISAPQGNNTLYYYSTDLAGNTESTKTLSIKVDTISPVIQSFFMNVPNGTSINSTDNMTFYANITEVNPEEIEFFANGENKLNISYTDGEMVSWVWTDANNYVEDTVNFTIQVDDLAANSVWGGRLELFVNDVTEPSVYLMNLSDTGWVDSTSVNFSWHANDTLSLENCSLLIDGVVVYTDTNALPGISDRVETVSEGAHYWNVNCYDGSGLLGTATNTNFTVDIVAPQVNLTSPINGGIVDNGTFNISWLYYDNLHTHTCSWRIYDDQDSYVDGDVEPIGQQTGTYSVLIDTLDVGNYSWNVTCLDFAYNSAYSATHEFRVRDIVAPTVDLQTPGNEYVSITDSVSFQVIVDDNLDDIDNCSLLIDGITNITDDNVSAGVLSFGTVTNIVEGPHNWSATCTDEDGNIGYSAYRYFEIDTIPPTVHSVYPENGALTDNSTIIFVANVQDNTTIQNCSLYLNNTYNQGVNNTQGNFSFAAVSLDDGKHDWKVACEDEGGLVGYGDGWNVTVDTTNPTITQSVSGGSGVGPWFTSNVLITLTANDNVPGVYAQYNKGLGWKNYTVPFNLTKTVELASRAIDAVGHVSTEYINFSIDKVAPSTEFIVNGSRSGDYYTSTVYISLESKEKELYGKSGIANTYYKTDAGSWTVYNTTFTVSGDGAHTIQAYAIDTAGNNETVVNTTFSIDTQTPTVMVTSHVNDQRVNGVQTLVMNTTATDIAEVSWYVGDSLIEQIDYADMNYSFIWNTALYDDGTYTHEFVVKDKAGHTNNTEIDLIVDNTAPTVEITNPSQTKISSGPVTIEGTVSGSDVAMVQLSINGVWRTVNNTNGTWDYTTSPNQGFNYLAVKAKDTLNQWSDVDESYFRFDDIDPAISGVSISPTQANTDTPSFTVSAQITEANSLTTVRAKINGSSWVSMSGSGTYVTALPNTITSEGTHTIIIEATDEFGNTNTQNTNIVINDSIPSITFNPVNNSYVANGSIIQVLFGGIANATVTVNGQETLTTANYNLSINASHNDTINVSVIAYTLSGVNSTGYARYVVDADTPQLTVTTKNNLITNNQSVNITGTATDDNLLAILVNGVTTPTLNKEVELTEGNNTINVTVKDKAGQKAESITYVFKDTVKPTVTRSLSGTAGTNGWYISNVTLTFQASDASPSSGAVAQWYNGTQWMTVNQKTLSDGEHTLIYRALDNAGNAGNNKTITVKIDTVKPVYTTNLSIEPEEAESGKDYVVVTVNATGGIRGTLKANNITYNMTKTGNKYSVTLPPFSTVGSYTTTARIYDYAGNVISKTDIISVIEQVEIENIEAEENETIEINESGSVNASLSIETDGAIQAGRINITLAFKAPQNNSLENSIKYLRFDEDTNINNSLEWVTIKIYYSDAEVAGLDETELQMYWYNTTGDTWLALNSTMSWVNATGVNTDANYVWAKVSHFSTYTFSSSKVNCTDVFDDEAVTSTCYDENGIKRSSGYMCSNSWQSSSCSTDTGNGGSGGNGGGITLPDDVNETQNDTTPKINNDDNNDNDGGDTQLNNSIEEPNETNEITGGTLVESTKEDQQPDQSADKEVEGETSGATPVIVGSLLLLILVSLIVFFVMRKPEEELKTMIQHIKEAESKGFGETEVRAYLLKKGFEEKQVEKALKKAKI